MSDLADWLWSSFVDYAGLRAGTLCDQREAGQLLDIPMQSQQFIDWVLQTMPADEVSKMY